MYTQCPECQIAFRVTVKVLRQTGDNVRCESCGHAFNALDFLSEDMPGHASPGVGDTADEPAGDLAESRQRPLETLDELSGPDDVRIEEIGTEWRVLNDTGAAEGCLPSEERDGTEEPRYDDNTPLPDDFGDEGSDGPVVVPQPREQGYPLITVETEDQHGDLVLSEPEDWTDILEEVRDPTLESPEIKGECPAIHSELSAIDDGLTDEVPQADGDVPAPEDDEPDDIATDQVEQIEAGAAAEPDADEIDDDVDDAAPGEDEDTGEPFNVAAMTVGVENPGPLFDERPGEIETIVMESDLIRSEVGKASIAAEHGTRSQLDDPATLVDTSAMNRGKTLSGQPGYDRRSLVIVALIVGLTLVLVGQFVHNHRQSLATYNLFNATMAPVYRWLGSPVTPEWDVNGWQFEATNGSIDDENTRLTIVSRITNRSNQPLPYPLVHIELTDRFDDVTGSAILEPADYLAVDGDPGRPIAPGDKFTATINMDDPSAEVYGYRLKVCYRTKPGAVRCAAEAFRD